MAASKLPSYQDELEDEFTCSVCMELYNNADKLPKLLPCSHTFCMACTMQYADKHLGGTFKCPLCNTDVALKSSDIDKLPNNLTIISLMGRMKKISLSEKPKPKVDCEKHGLSVEHICLTCKEVLCANCVVAMVTEGLHQKHNIALIDNAFAEKRKQIDKSSQSLSAAYQALIEKQSSMIETFDQYITAQKKDIEEIATGVQQAMDEWKNNSLTNLQQALNNTKLRTSREIEDFTKELSSVEDHLTKAAADLDMKNIDVLCNNTISMNATTMCNLCSAYDIDVPIVTLKRNSVVQPATLVIEQKEQVLL